MIDIHSLAQQMAALEDLLQVCGRCGLCQTVCPVFAETGREADVARGKLALLVALQQEMFRDPAGVRDRLERCVLCGSCEASCPSGVKTLEIFLRARAILTGYLGLSPLKKLLFRRVMRHPALFDRLLALAARVQGLFLRPVADAKGLCRPRDMLSILQGRFVPPLAVPPLHKQINFVTRPAAAGQPTVGVFVGCLIDKVFPGVGRAMLRVLQHHGVGVWVPSDQGCCGLPALAAGESKTFQALVRHNLETFLQQPMDYLITACASCTAAIKLLWPRLSPDLSATPRPEAAFLAAKTMDISQFLVDVLGVGAVAPGGGDKIRVAYHDPCHLRKSLGVSTQPRILLRHHPHLQLMELPQADWCCGGGSFALQHPQESLGIGRRKLDNILAADCQVVATGCPACQLQLLDLLSHAEANVQVKHTIEIYADSLA